MSDAVDFPPEWKRDSRFPQAISELLIEHDIGWLQGCCELGFSLCAMLYACDDDELRLGVAEALARLLLDVGRTGQMPGMVVE